MFACVCVRGLSDGGRSEHSVFSDGEWTNVTGDVSAHKDRPLCHRIFKAVTASGCEASIYDKNSLHSSTLEIGL